MKRAPAALMFLAACSTDRVDITPGAGADKNRGAVVAALAELRAAKHTPAAFRAYSDRLLALRTGMDATVAEEAELLTVTEAYVVMTRAIAAGVATRELVLTVFPLALAPPIAADVPGLPSADEWAIWVPRPDENDAAYLERLCGGELALECKDVVPEGQLPVVYGLVIERFTLRARRAVQNCLTCNEPGWKNTVVGWEGLDQEATAKERALRQEYRPSKWPVAGEGAVAVPDDVPAVVFEAGDRAERVRYVIADAGKVALIARDAAYPYRKRAYLMSSTNLPVRDGEPVQVLVRALDAAARRRSER